jgi:hypothetical protein
MSESDETMSAKQAPESGPSRKSDTILGPSGYHVSTSEPHDNIERASEPSRYDEPRRFQVDAPPPRTAGTDCWSCRGNLTTSLMCKTRERGASHGAKNSNFSCRRLFLLNETLLGSREAGGSTDHGARSCVG